MNNLQQLVIERLKRLPIDLQISVGSSSYSKTDVLDSVKAQDNLGKQIMDMQLRYLQDLASGKIYSDE